MLTELYKVSLRELSNKLIDKNRIMTKQENSKNTNNSNELYTVLSTGEKERLLKNFLLDNFDFKELKKIGFYSKDVKKNDYQKQADRICQFFGFETVYQYGFETTYAHISYVKGKEPKDQSFLMEFKAWHES